LLVQADEAWIVVSSRRSLAIPAGEEGGGDGGGQRRRTEAEPNRGSIYKNPNQNRGYSVNDRIAISNRDPNEGAICTVKEFL
jgi:hypothetical protein